MIRKLILAGAFALGITPAQADDKAPLWSQVGSWTVRVDPSQGNGCFMTAKFTNGAVVRIGLDNNRRGYWVIGHYEWASLVPGRSYAIRVVFDNMAAFNGDMVAERWGSSVFLVHGNLNKDFMWGLMKAVSMDVYYNGRPVTSLRMTGSMAAGWEVVRCQQQLDGITTGNTGGNRYGRDGDPFRQ